MRNRQAWEQRIQKEREGLKDYEVFESEDYRQMLCSVAKEITGGTLGEVKLVKEPRAGYGGSCSSKGVRLNIENRVTVSFPSIALRSESIVGILGHECGHWNFSDFQLRKKYLSEMKKGRWIIQLPVPKKFSGQEQMSEIHEFLTGDYPAARYVMAETASFIQNLIEDVYVEELMCRQYPGSIRRGILQNRMREMEQIPSLKEQLKNGYCRLSVLLNLMTQYALTGTVNNWEMENSDLLEILEEIKPVIDKGIWCKDSSGRMEAANQILLLIWEVLKAEIDKIEEQLKKKPLISENNENRQEEKETPDDSKIQKEWDKIQKEIPDFLCTKDEEISSVSQGKKELRLKSGQIEMKDQLFRCMEKIAETKAEQTYNEEISRALLRELGGMKFDGDHQKVKKTVERKAAVTESDIARYETVEGQAKQTARKIKEVLLPVLSQTGEHTEKYLFFGTKLNMQALFDPFGRVYQKKEAAKKLDAAVAILVDLSGSMCGNRIEQTMLCCLSLYKFCDSSGIPILIYGHHTNGERYSPEKEQVTLQSFAEFEPDRNDGYRIASMAATGANRDGAALSYVGEKLLKRPERTKLLFCISDGYPNGALYSGEHAANDIQRIKKRLETMGVIVMAAAIGSDKDRIAKIYQEGYLDISDLDVFAVVLAREILKRIRR